MSIENRNKEQMYGELQAQRTTFEAVRAGLIGKEMGSPDTSSDRELMQLLEKTGLQIEVSALTPAVAEQLTTYAEQAVALAEEHNITPAETEFAVQAAEQAAAEQVREGTGALYLFDRIKLSQPIARFTAMLAVMILLVSGCVMPDVAQAATETPDQATTLDIDDAEQTLDDATATSQPTKRTRPTAQSTPQPTVVETVANNDEKEEADERLAAAPTATTTRTPRPTTSPTPTKTPEATAEPTVEATPTPLPRLEVIEGIVEVPGVYIPVGVNIRTSPEYDTENPDKNLFKGLDIELPTEFEASTDIVTADGYNWIEFTFTDSSGNTETLYVAEVAGVTKTVIEKPTIEVGGLISDQALLSEAVGVLPEIQARAYAVGEYNGQPAIVDRVGDILALKGQDEIWYLNAAINLGAEIDTDTEDGVDSDVIEMTERQVQLYSTIPPTFKEKAEVLTWEFDISNGWWKLPEGRVPGKTAWLPAFTHGELRLEDGAFNPEDGFKIQDPQSGGSVEFYVMGDETFTKNARWVGTDSEAATLVTTLKERLKLDASVPVQIFNVKDVTGQNPRHLNGQTIDYFLGGAQFLGEKIILLHGETSAQVIIAKDKDGVPSGVICYISQTERDFKTIPEENRAEVAVNYAIVEAIQAMYLQLNGGIDNPGELTPIGQGIVRPLYKQDASGAWNHLFTGDLSN